MQTFPKSDDQVLTHPHFSIFNRTLGVLHWLLQKRRILHQLEEYDYTCHFFPSCCHLFEHVQGSEGLGKADEGENSHCHRSPPVHHRPKPSQSGYDLKKQI